MQKIIKSGLATGIGSLPHKDIPTALGLITKYCPEMPHWAQLPAYNPAEGLVEQYLGPLQRAGLITQEPGRAPYINTRHEGFAEGLAKFYEQFLSAEEDPSSLEAYAFPKKNAAGYYGFIEVLKSQTLSAPTWLKGHLTGPITTGLQLCDDQRRSTYYDPQLKDVVVKNAALQAAWQARDLGQFGYPVIVFIDEPSMYAFGSSTHVTLTAEEVTEDINQVVDALHRENALSGVHVCARTDWSVLLNSRVDVISFDAYSFFSSVSVYPAEVASFINRGGFLAWGIVPTYEAVLHETGESLLSRYEEYVDALAERGVSKQLLIAQTIFTPSCGTGSLSIELAETVYSKLSELIAAYHNKY